MKWGYAVCGTVMALLAFAFVFMPFFVKLPVGSGPYVLGGAGLMVTLSVLFGMRYSSLVENDTIYRAITKQTKENTDEPK